LKNKQRREKDKVSIKTEVLEHYSGNNPPKCARCCTTDISRLTIDHINNDGAKMRRRHPYQKRHILRWLKKNGYPEGYQVLCKRCNTEKRLESKVFLAGEIVPGSIEETSDQVRVKLEFPIPKPMKKIISNGKLKIDHVSLITKDFQDAEK
jgi:hypothetical protein